MNISLSETDCYYHESQKKNVVVVSSTEYFALHVYLSDFTYLQKCNIDHLNILEKVFETIFTVY